MYDEMKMIGHKAEAKEFDRVLGFRRGEEVEEGGIVALFVKHRRAAISTIQDMVGVTRDLAARNPRHERRSIGEERTRRQAKSSLSPFLAQIYKRDQPVRALHRLLLLRGLLTHGAAEEFG